MSDGTSETNPQKGGMREEADCSDVVDPIDPSRLCGRHCGRIDRRRDRRRAGDGLDHVTKGDEGDLQIGMPIREPH